MLNNTFTRPLIRDDDIKFKAYLTSSNEVFYINIKYTHNNSDYWIKDNASDYDLYDADGLHKQDSYNKYINMILTDIKIREMKRLEAVIQDSNKNKNRVKI
jgi:hypothetical protein